MCRLNTGAAGRFRTPRQCEAAGLRPRVSLPARQPSGFVPRACVTRSCFSSAAHGMCRLNTGAVGRFRTPRQREAAGLRGALVFLQRGTWNVPAKYGRCRPVSHTAAVRSCGAATPRVAAGPITIAFCAAGLRGALVFLQRGTWNVPAKYGRCRPVSHAAAARSRGPATPRVAAGPITFGLCAAGLRGALVFLQRGTWNVPAKYWRCGRFRTPRQREAAGLRPRASLPAR